jgi:hypothetical protein
VPSRLCRRVLTSGVSVFGISGLLALHIDKIIQQNTI